jgi:hypothetical protein
MPDLVCHTQAALWAVREDLAPGPEMHRCADAT